jgi:hypothetical protein
MKYFTLNFIKMKINVFVILLMFLFSLFSNKSVCQISSFFRYSNVVYYKIKDLSDENLRGTNLGFGDKKVKNRYFDTLLKNDSLKVIIEGTSYYFKQKIRIEPKEYKEIILYRIRYLKNDSITIRSLKIIDIDKNYINVEAKIHYALSDKGIMKNKVILIPKDEIEGVFLGTGKNTRHAFIVTEIVAGIAAVILVVASFN